MVIALDCDAGGRGFESISRRRLFILLLANHVFSDKTNKAFSHDWREEERRGREGV